jgi:hypothetical protein
MAKVPPRPTAAWLAATLLPPALLVCGSARGQSIEPRAYSPAPVGMNFVVAGYSDSEGGLSIDPALPVTNPRISLRSPIVAYTRAIDLFGKASKVDVIVPYGELSGSATYKGQAVSRQVQGFADPLFRVSTTLWGAPALSAAEFRNYRQDLLVAASLQVVAPLGQYDDSRLLNLSAHRWSVKPEIGASKVVDRWTLEVAAAATFYSDNNDFFGGHTRSQAPIYSAQGHLIYNLRSGAWAALDATWFSGGDTSLDGTSDHNLQRNWRLGLTLAVPVTQRVSLKFNASKGVSARTANSYDLLGVAWQYRFGGGL